ncbi:MAG: hypothetical protein ACP5O8_01470 [Candidatus Aenigmatarchaeota archaeon]
MPIQIDFTVAVGIFIVIIGISLAFVINYLTKYSQYSKIANLKTIAYNLFIPLKLNLTTELFKLPVKISEVSGDDRVNAIIKLSLSFDETCGKKAWNSTVRVYDEENREVEFSLYNQTFCESRYLKSSDLVLKSNFSAYQTKIFFLYFSAENTVKDSNYSVPFEEAPNFTVEVYPLQELKMLSISKLKELRNINYDDLVKALGNYNFYLEISEK